MGFFMACFIGEDQCLQSVFCRGQEVQHSIVNHCKTFVGKPIFSIFQILRGKGEEGFFSFNHVSYAYTFFADAAGGQILLISDVPVKLRFAETLIDEISEGVQFFNQDGMLTYLNQACEQMENLRLANVSGKHVLEIYEVDQEYSTIMNTLKDKAKVEDRCGIFQNKNGDKLYSINSGIPVFSGEVFLGAIGLVYDKNVLAGINEKNEKINQYLQKNNQKQAISIHGHEDSQYHSFAQIIGHSEAIEDCIRLSKKVANTDASVLLYGETGTGKEIFAQSIHRASARKDKKFVAVNCAALPPGIIESLLFGTSKGAYTGSVEKKGLLESASGGTIFLDEINSMAIELQAKLLRVIQAKEFRKLGDTKTTYADIRFITAMNESPLVAIHHHRLREDLYFRIAVLSIEIPPLSAREDDVFLLADFYLAQLSRRHFRDVSLLSPEVRQIFLHYPWPGNVRELFHVLEFACMVAEDRLIEKKHLPKRLLALFSDTQQLEGKDEAVSSLQVQDKADLTIQQQLVFTEIRIIKEALAKNKHNISKTARELGIKRQNLQYRMKKYQIKGCY